MAYPTQNLQTMESPVYRPQKLPRVIRRQLPVVRLLAGIVLVGLIAGLTTWRNLAHERLTLDIGTQRDQIATLDKEIQHLQGQIETETSFPRVAKWARDHRGWRALPNHSSVFSISESDLTPAAREEARLMRNLTHE
jgi:hypothetical protein